MPEMRRDPITKNWVVIASERAKRIAPPIYRAVAEIEKIEYEKNCFFCSGNEHTTPPETLSYRQENTVSDSPGWEVRVVPNKFAALNLEHDFHIIQENSLKVFSWAAGVSEVVIETNRHLQNLALCSTNQVANVLRAYRDRYLAISKENSIKYILIFRNNRKEAGATIEHPHSQIIATPIIPLKLSEEFSGAYDYYESTGRCVFCDIVKMETKDRQRIICENELFVSFTPYSSRVPYECWIMPKYHTAGFQDLDEIKIAYLSEIWKATLYKLYAGLDNPPYNYYIHTSPVKKNMDKYFHWHMELLPKLNTPAGFELGTGMYINIAIPEESAEYLRGLEVK